MINRYGQSLRSAHSGYTAGIKYYRVKANQFLTLMQRAQQEALELSYTSYAQRVNAELMAQQPEDFITVDMMTTFETQIRELANNIIMGNSHVTSIVSSSPGKTAIDNKNYLRNYAQRIRSALDAEVLTSSVKDQILYIYSQAFNTQAIDTTTISALYGYLRRQIIANIVNGPASLQQRVHNSLSGYLNVFKGIIGESVGESALNKVLKTSAQKAGSIRGAQGKQTSIDIVIGDRAASLNNTALEDLINQLEVMDTQVSETIELLPETQFWGGQVKTWNVPTASVPNDRTFRSIGSRVELRNKYGFDKTLPKGQTLYERGWHHSADIIGQHIEEFIGPNTIFYIANQRFYWTADLISTFRQASYFLTFYYNRKTSSDRSYKFSYPTKGEVVWQRQMYKNMYQLKKRK